MAKPWRGVFAAAMTEKMAVSLKKYSESLFLGRVELDSWSDLWCLSGDKENKLVLQEVVMVDVGEPVCWFVSLDDACVSVWKS